MERKIATKLTPRIAEFVKEKSGLDYPVNQENLFYYPNFLNHKGFKDDYHVSKIIVDGYEELTEQEFINYFKYFEFGERVLCDDGIERIFLFKKNDIYYCINEWDEIRFNRSQSISLKPFESIQKLEQKIQELEQKIQEPTKEEKLNKIIEQLKELL